MSRELAAERIGIGTPVVLLHGGMSEHQRAWAFQGDLAERWQLVLVDRAGYGDSAAISRGEDIELDAELLSTQLGELGEPAHLVGHSSGAVAALLTAAKVPTAVRSVTAIEPPSYRAHPASVPIADAYDPLFDDRSTPHDAFEALNDHIADRLGAERAVVSGAGHGVQYTGAPFNDVLEDFLRRH